METFDGLTQQITLWRFNLIIRTCQTDTIIKIHPILLSKLNPNSLT